MFGVSSYCLMDQPLSRALDTLAEITGLIEVMDEGLHAITDPGILENYSQDFVIHAPFHGMNIASVFESIRRASVGIMADCFAVAAEIGAPVVIHPGYYAWAQEQEEADRQFRKSLAELRAAAGELSVTFYFENMGDMHFFNLRTPEDLRLIDGNAFVLDVGHAHLNGRLPGFLKTGFSHMHIHDNKGERDSHDAVGTGTIDFVPVVAALRHNKATSVVEVRSFAGVISSLAALESL